MSIKKLVIFIIAGISIAAPVSAASWATYDQAWIYPGGLYTSVNCNAMTDIQDGRFIENLNPQYWAVNTSGALVEDTVASAGCNGYSTGNASLVKQYSKNQYITVSGAYGQWNVLVASPSLMAAATSTLTNFVVDNGFTGIELDWEGWYPPTTAQDFTNYKTFVTALASSLHANGKKLMVDGPTLQAQGTNLYHYDQVEPLVDYQIVQGYDLASTVGQDLVTKTQMSNVMTFVAGLLSTPSTDLIIGMPAYGYHGPTGGTYCSGGCVTNVPSSIILTNTGSSTATQDANYEWNWTNGGNTYFYQNTSTEDSLRTYMEGIGGLYAVSVWTIGGNPFFDPSILEPGQTTTTPQTSNTPTLTIAKATLTVAKGTFTIAN